MRWMERFDLSDLLTKQIANLLPTATDKGITLNIVADLAKLARLFINLIDNAVKYSNPGDCVTVTALMENKQARITIRDTGPSIPSEHLPHLFERFYRVDKARSRSESMNTANSGSGAGLGLSIVEWLVKAHNGRIEVESQIGQGTTFIVWLPLEPSIPHKVTQVITLR